MISFDKGGMRGIFFLVLCEARASENLPLPLFFKEGIETSRG